MWVGVGVCLCVSVCECGRVWVCSLLLRAVVVMTLFLAAVEHPGLCPGSWKELFSSQIFSLIYSSSFFLLLKTWDHFSCEACSSGLYPEPPAVAEVCVSSQHQSRKAGELWMPGVTIATELLQTKTCHVDI